MTPSSHLWATSLSLPWLSVLTANENLSSHLDLTQASLVCHICCALFSFCFSASRGALSSFNSLIQPPQTPAPAFFHSVRNPKSRTQQVLVLLTDQNPFAASEKSKERQTESDKQIQGLRLQQDLNRMVLRMFSMAKPMQIHFRLSLKFFLHYPFAISRNITPYLCGVCCGHIAQVLMCLTKKRL